MGVMGVVVDGCEEPLVGTIGMIGTGAACELVSWSFAGSGVSEVVEIFGTAEILETLGAGAVCEPASWSCSGSGAAGLVRTIGSGGSGGFFAPKEAVAQLGQMRQLGQGSVAGLLALAHLRHLRQLGQVFLPQVCWWAPRRAAPGRDDPGWYRGHAPG